MNQKNVIVLLSIILASIIIVGIILVSVFNQNISELKNIILNNESALFGQIGNVGAQVSSMTDNIQTMLDKQESLIAGYQIAYSNPNAQTLKCDLSVTVTPKTYSEDTTADLNIGGNIVPMTRSGNAYVAKKSISLTEVNEASVTFQQGDINETEILPEIIDGSGTLRSSLYTEHYGDCVSWNDTFSMDGTLKVFFHPMSGEGVTTARLVALEKGKEIWSEDIADSVQTEQEIPFNHSFNTANEDDILIYTEVIGTSGIIYRRNIFATKETDTDGVYDANGNLIEFDEYSEY
jgi:hypothetical protein